MQALPIISLIANVILGITVLSLVYPKGIQYYRQYKKQRQTKRDKERNKLKQLIRKEVRDYLKELQQ